MMTDLNTERGNDDEFLTKLTLTGHLTVARAQGVGNF